MRLASALVAVFLVAACAHGGARGDVLGARRDLARAMLDRGDLGGAYALVQPLLRDHPADAEALAIRGTILREQGMLVEAEADLKDAIARRPGLAFAHASLGILYDLQGKSADAEKHHRAAVEHEPRNPRYLNNLAFSLFAHGQAREAIPLYLEAVRHDPENPRLRNNLGFAYAVAGDWPRAKRQFDAASSPSDARLNLGYAYEKAGLLAQAHALYQEAVQLDPKSQYARESLARVARNVGRPLPGDAAGAPLPDAAEGRGGDAPREVGP